MLVLSALPPAGLRQSLPQSQHTVLGKLLRLNVLLVPNLPQVYTAACASSRSL